MKRRAHKNTALWYIISAEETQSQIRFTQKVQHLTAMSWPQKYDALRKGIKVRSKTELQDSTVLQRRTMIATIWKK